MGAANGVLTGMTGSFVLPGVMYLQAIGLSRNELVQAMGILFTLSTLTLTLGLALGNNGLLDTKLGLLSMAALAPALAGMTIGQKVRDRMSEARFKTALFSALLVMGLYLLPNLIR